MLKPSWQIAAVTFLCASGAFAQSSSVEDSDLRKIQCFAVLVIAAGAKKPDQKFFAKPEYLELIAQCNASPESCRQTVEEIKEKRWPVPPSLSCGG